MKQPTTYDAAEFLETEEDIIAYLDAVLDDGNPEIMAAALDDIDRACNTVPAKTLSALSLKSATKDGLSFSKEQSRYNAETESAIREARDIVNGKIRAESYDSPATMFAAFDRQEHAKTSPTAAPPSGSRCRNA